MAVSRKNLPSARPVRPSTLMRSRRRRAELEAQRDASRERYTNLAQRLQFIAEEFTAPEDADIRADLFKFINKIRLQGRPPKQKDFERVLEAIRDRYCYCVYDIHEETHLPIEAVWKIIEGLLATGAIIKKVGDLVDGERDDVGILFYVTNSPSTPAVLP
jgi:hypothetical protein